jgi:hypothetical protein
VSLEQSQGAIHRDPVDLRIKPAGASQQLASIKVLFGGFDHAQNGAALASHAQAARHKFSLQTPRNLGFR